MHNNNNNNLRSSALSNVQRFDLKRHFKELAVNEHNRYFPNSSKIGHALLSLDPSKLEARQFDINLDKDSGIEVLRLKNITRIHDHINNREQYHAETESGIKMQASRCVRFKYGPTEYETEEEKLLLFSPIRTFSTKFGFLEDLETSKDLFDNDKQNKLIAENIVYKGGERSKVEGHDVALRETMSRYPSQNQVMGRRYNISEKSAKEEFAEFLNKNRTLLKDEFVKILERSANASMGNNHRPEWLHALGFSLSAIGSDPQNSNNLGAAPKWANTEMMILERIAKWFSLNRPDIIIHVKPLFQMIYKSEIIKRISLNVELQGQNKYIKFFQDFNPLSQYPQFRKASDLAQATFIADQLLEGVSPSSIQAVGYERVRNTKMGKHVTFKQEEFMQAGPSGVIEEKRKKINVSYDNSVVEIVNHSKEYDYLSPWSSPALGVHHGSGFILQYKGNKFIVSNAHVASDATYLKLRFSSDEKYYKATVKRLENACDIALLDVEDQKFWEKASCLELGDVIGLEEKVKALGFPMGGEEISITNGRATRQEVAGYLHSKANLLRLQVDAAINPGNSGGPIISNGKVVGVAFQGIYGEASLLHYVIPVPILQHVLDDYLEHNNTSFPSLAIKWQNLKNDGFREKIGLKDSQTGVRIVSIPKLSSAYGLLKKGDVLLSIDNKPIHNDGTVSLGHPLGNRIFFSHLITQKFIGDTIKANVFRDGKVLDIDIPLTHNHGYVKKVGAYKYNEEPRFYINSLIAFMPLTQNYIEAFEEQHGELTESISTAAEEKKDEETDEAVIIANIFASEYTEGYSRHNAEVVKKVNDIKIKSFNHLLEVMKDIKYGDFTIKLESGEILYIPKIPKKAYHAILAANGIDRISSEESDMQDENDEAMSVDIGDLLKLISGAEKPKATDKGKAKIIEDDDATEDDTSDAETIHTNSTESDDEEEEDEEDSTLASSFVTSGDGDEESAEESEEEAEKVSSDRQPNILDLFRLFAQNSKFKHNPRLDSDPESDEEDKHKSKKRKM